MTDMTTKEMGLRLRTMFIGRGDENFLQYQARIAQEACELANILDPPDPKFQEGTWAFCDGELCRLDKPRPDKGDCAWDVKDINDLHKGWANENEFELLSINLADLALAYHARKPLLGYISLKDLPELPEGWEYTGEYRPPQLNEWFFGDHQGYGVCECATPGVRAFRLIVRRKAQP